MIFLKVEPSITRKNTLFLLFSFIYRYFKLVYIYEERFGKFKVHIGELWKYYLLNLRFQLPVLFFGFLTHKFQLIRKL
jgi:hypothetical protein